MKKHPHILACVLFLLPVILGLSLQEDDLVFDDAGEENDNDKVPAGPSLLNHHTSRGRSDHEHGSSSRNGWRHSSRVERAWGVPDAVVPVGHVFKMKIPRQAFSGNVDFYEVSPNDSHLVFPDLRSRDQSQDFLVGSFLHYVGAQFPDEKDTSQLIRILSQIFLPVNRFSINFYFESLDTQRRIFLIEYTAWKISKKIELHLS